MAENCSNEVMDSEESVNKNEILVDEMEAALIDRELPGQEVVEYYPQRISNGNTLLPTIDSSEAEHESSSFFCEFICPVCQSEFCVETGDPRMLNCGHNVCSNCLLRLNPDSYDNLLIECPVCRDEFKVEKNKNEIPISLTLKQMLVKFKTNKKHIKKSIPPQPYEGKGPDSSPFGNCKEHNLPVHFGCVSCKMWLCGKCACTLHSGDQHKCEVFSINEAVVRIRKEVSKELKERLNATNVLQVKRDKLKESLKALKNCYNNQIRSSSFYSTDLVTKNKVIVNKLKLAAEKVESMEEMKLKSHLCSNLTAEECYEAFDQLKKWKENTFFLIQDDRWKYKNFTKWFHYLLDKRAVNNAKAMKSICLQTFQKEEIHKEWKKSAIVTLDRDGDTVLQINCSNYCIGCPKVNSDFFDPTKQTFYAFMDISEENSDDVKLRLRFEVDDNILGYSFLERLKDKSQFYATLQGSIFKKPFTDRPSICFGEKLYKIDYISYTKYELNKNDGFKKAITKGAVGIYNNFDNDNCLRNNMLTYYINMETETSIYEDLPFFSKDSPGSTYNQLKYCFGRVSEGLDELELLMNKNNGRLQVANCGIHII